MHRQGFFLGEITEMPLKDAEITNMPLEVSKLQIH
jgi:hypothetical protein